ncbi:uncharacterized protein LOC113596219 [Acinonyx jubatus]|uniref:Uncharacterized protein LOC113596219 n=1 Tax=Acinonyx jubatus TaxID=32536 RepID=A0ABM3P0Z4_ACIJB|nr:uncharacterized protein LOC113596219 [Acinonyx jubatus]
MVVIPAMVPTQPLLALGFLPPPLGAAAASHPHFRLLLPEIPELAHPPGCGVTAAPCRDRPRAGGPRRERGAGPFPAQQRGAGQRRARATMATGRRATGRPLPRSRSAGPRGVRLHRAPDAAPASTHRTQAPNSGAGTGQGLLGPSLRRARLCSLRSAPGGPRHPQSHPWVSGRGEGPVPLAGSSLGSGEGIWPALPGRTETKTLGDRGRSPCARKKPTGLGALLPASSLTGVQPGSPPGGGFF